MIVAQQVPVAVAVSRWIDVNDLQAQAAVDQLLHRHGRPTEVITARRPAYRRPSRGPRPHFFTERGDWVAYLLHAVLQAHGRFENWRQFGHTQATIVTRGEPWAIKGQPHDPFQTDE